MLDGTSRRSFAILLTIMQPTGTDTSEKHSYVQQQLTRKKKLAGRKKDFHKKKNLLWVDKLAFVATENSNDEI